MNKASHQRALTKNEMWIKRWNDLPVCVQYMRVQIHKMLFIPKTKPGKQCRTNAIQIFTHYYYISSILLDYARHTCAAVIYFKQKLLKFLFRNSHLILVFEHFTQRYPTFFHLFFVSLRLMAFFSLPILWYFNLCCNRIVCIVDLKWNKYDFILLCQQQIKRKIIHGVVTSE